ncbi:MAG: iron-containing alcohol dehydrogenase [Aggregatilineales bacterium]
MTTIWNLPRIVQQPLHTISEERPTALLTGRRSWDAVGSMFQLPVVVQAEPHTTDHVFLDNLADNLPPQVEVVYAVGGGLVADVAKYIGWKRNLPVVIVPTALSVDGFFTAIVAVRQYGTVHYVTTGPAEAVYIDWDVVSKAAPHYRGTGIAEILSIVTGLLDWRYAAEQNKNPPAERFKQWAAGLAAGIAQQAFKIADGVGKGQIDALQNLLDLICMEVRLTNQLGHNRPQEGSEQYFAYAIEPKVARDRGIPYADLVGPGILISAALHGQNIDPIRATLDSAGIRLSQLRSRDIEETLLNLPDYVREHELPFSILHDMEMTPAKVGEVLEKTGLDRV